MERGEVVEREIAVADEADFLPARNGAGNPRISTGNGQAILHGAPRRNRQGAAAMDHVGVNRAPGGYDLAAIDLAGVRGGAGEDVLRAALQDQRAGGNAIVILRAARLDGGGVRLAARGDVIISTGDERRAIDAAG